MMRFVTACVFLFLSYNSYCQTVILDDPTGESYNQIDDNYPGDYPLVDNYDLDISDCTSVEFSIDYDFSLPWQGSMNMEKVDECGGCAGDPANPLTTGCLDCWDFMWMQVFIDGVEDCANLIGDAATTDAEQSGTWNPNPKCTNGATDADFTITNLNWADNETNTFSNVMVLCWEAKPTVVTPPSACEGEEIDLDGSVTNPADADSYAWTTDGSASIADASMVSTTATGASDGDTFTLTVTDDNGCTASSSFTVNLTPAPEIMDPMIEECISDLENFDLTEVDGDVSGSGTVTWWDGQPSNAGTQLFPPVDISSGSGIDLWVQVEDTTTGCTSEIQVTVTESPAPDVIAGANDLDVCEGEDIELTETGGDATSWMWDGPNGFGDTNQNPVISPSTAADAGTYNVTITDINGCTAIDMVTITVNGEPAVIAGANDLDVCEGDDIELTETGGDATSWMWDGPNGFSDTNQNPVISPSTAADAGTYNVTVTDAIGCTAVDMVTITVNGEPAVIAGANDIEVCEGDDIELTETGGDATSWMWDGPNGFNDTNQNPVISPSTAADAGTYNVTVTDVIGCTAVDMVVIDVLAPPTATATATNLTVCVGQDIELMETGGDGVSWMWDGPNGFSDTNQNPTISPAVLADDGIYTVTVTDANDCTSTAEVDIEVVDAPMGCISGAAEICEGGCGDFSFNLTGGSGDYTGSISFSFLGLPFGPFDLPIVGLNSMFTLCFDPDASLPSFTGTTVTLPTCDPFGIICLSEGDVITLTLEGLVDNVTGCDGVVEPAPCTQSITFHAAPEAIELLFEGCEDESAMNYDITQHDSEVNTMGETVTWFDGEPSNGGTQIGPTIDLTDDDLDLWAKVVSAFGCCSEVQMVLNLQETPTVSVTGGGELCIGECTDSSPNVDNFSFDVQGGVGPYCVNFLANGDQFVYQNVGMGISTFQICFEDINQPWIINNNVVPPSITFDIDVVINNVVEIISVLDKGTSCFGTILDPSDAKYDLLPNAEINEIDNQFSCADPSGFACFDLTSLDDDIVVSPPGSAVMWWSGPNCDVAIVDPTNHCISGDVFVCYTVQHATSGCETDPVMIMLDYEPSPMFDPIDDVEYCGDDYNLPFPTGTNLTGNEMFFTGPGGTGTSYSPNDIYNPGINPTTLYVYDSNSPNCSSEISFELCVVEIPLIVQPQGEVSACAEYILPPIDVFNGSGTATYYGGSGATGTIYAPGTVITSDITLYVYIDNGCGCIDEKELIIDITDEIIFEVPEIPEACGFVKLPEITNSTGTAIYSTSSNSVSNPFWSPCDTIFDTDGISTLYVYDPNDTGCVTNNGLEILINIAPSPIVDAQQDIVVCDSVQLSTITGIDLTGNEAYFSGSNGMGVSFMAGDWVSTNTTLYIYDTNGTCGTEDTLSISIETIDNPGLGDTLRICEGFTDLVDLSDYITGADGGGSWIDLSGFSLNLTDATMVDLSSLPAPGNYNVDYGFSSVVCGDATSTIRIEVYESPLINVDPLDQICNSTDMDIMLFDYVSAFTMGSYYTNSWTELVNPSLFGITGMPNPTVNFMGATPGLYQFVFEVESTLGDACPSAFDTIKIEVIEQLEAGPDVPITGCAGDVFDLTIFVGSYDPSLGSFDDLSGSGGLVGTDFNTTGLMPNSYDVEYIIMGVGACEPDTALLTITVTDVLEAGPGNEITVCEGAEIDLNTILAGGDVGGSFVDNASGNMISNPWVALNNTTLTYTIGGGSCPVDMAEIVVIVTPPPTINTIEPSGPLCDQSCFEYEITLGGSTAYMFDIIISNGSGIFATETINSNGTYLLTICNFDDLPMLQNDTLFVDNTNYDAWMISINNFTNAEGCEATALSPDFSFENIPTLSSEVMMDLCPGEIIFVNGTLYDESDPTGIETFNVNGCDSVVTVNLSYFEPATLDTVVNACQGDIVMLGGQTFDEFDMPTGSIDIAQGSINSCDSTINYTLNFVESIPVSIVGPYCEDEVVIINGNQYDFDDPDGTELIGGVNGDCDTLITIAMEFYTNVPTDFNPDFCTGSDPIELGGMFFDEGTPTGTVNLTSQFGCDSTVMVSLNVLESIIEPYGITEICPGDTIDIDGELFHEGNLTGQVNYPGVASNGCDSIVTVNLTLLSIEEGTETGQICPGETITILGMEFSEDMLEGTVVLENASVQGCDSTVNVSVELLTIPEGDYIDTLCNGQSFTLNGQVFDEDTPSGQVTLPGMAANGCDSLVNVALAFELEYTIEAFPPCPGEGQGSLVVVSSVGGELPFSLTIANTQAVVEITSLPFSIPIAPDNYEVTIIDVNGCELTYAVEVPQASALDFDLLAILSGTNTYDVSIVSDITDFTSINWEPSDLASCQDCESSSFDVYQTETVYVTASFGDGCTVTDSVTLNFQKVVSVYIPNVFNPSLGDENGSFFPQTDNDNDLVNFMQIYDRWGELIFDAQEVPVNRPDVGWDGTFKGREVTQGVYVYVVEILYEDGQIRKQAGDITVIR